MPEMKGRTMRECLFCDFKVEADLRKTLADRLLATHFEDNHAKEIEPLTASVDIDRKLLVQFGDLIDRFEEEVTKRRETIELLSDLSEAFRTRIASAEAGIDHRIIVRREVMPMPYVEETTHRLTS